MAAIRWDNIDAPSFGGVANMLEAAGRQFNQATTGLGNIVQGAEAGQQTMIKQQQDEARQAAMARILGFTNPNDFGAAMQNGLAQDLTGKLNAANSEAVLKLLDGRQGTLQQRDLTGIQYKNAVTTAEQAQSKDAILVKILKGDIEGAKADLAASPNLVNVAPIYQTMNNEGWLNESRGQQRQVWKNTNELAPIQRGLVQSQADLHKANIDLITEKTLHPENFLSGGGKGKSKVDVNGKPILTDEDVTAYLEAKLAKETNPNATPFSREKFQKYVKDTFGDKEVAAGVLAGLSRLDARGFEYGKGEFTQFPQGVLEQAASEVASNPTWKWNLFSNSWADQFKEKVLDIMKRPDTVSSISQAADIQKALLEGPIARQKLAKELGMKLPGEPVAATPAAAATPTDGAALFMANPRVRNFATGGTMPASSLSYGDLAGTEEKKKR